MPANSKTRARQPSRRAPAPSRQLRPRDVSLVLGGIVAVLAIVLVGFAISTAAPQKTAPTSDGMTVQANGGQWTNITPDTLASMLTAKDFTLLNVKTPYVGEIAGTDLYIPYDQLTARAAELPPDKTAKVVVYCRSGNESAVSAQTLLDLGYTHIDNLDGGMTAWTDSGRSLVQVVR